MFKRKYNDGDKVIYDNDKRGTIIGYNNGLYTISVDNDDVEFRTIKKIKGLANEPKTKVKDVKVGDRIQYTCAIPNKLKNKIGIVRRVTSDAIAVEFPKGEYDTYMPTSHHSCLSGFGFRVFDDEFIVVDDKDYKFKYGDRVKLIRNNGICCKIGSQGTIIGASDKYYLVKFDEKPHSLAHNGLYVKLKWGHTDTEEMCQWCDVTDIELCDESTEKFKYGDIVEVMDTYGERRGIGMTGKIIGYSDEIKKYLVDFKDKFLITGIYGEYVKLKWGHCSETPTCQLLSENQIELNAPPVKKEIHITVKENTVNAIYKENEKLVKRSTAKCHPNDTFDFETGAKLAVDKLFEKPKKRYFDKFEYINNMGINEYKAHYKWVDDCHGREVIDGFVIGSDKRKYISDYEWEIEK